MLQIHTTRSITAVNSTHNLISCASDYFRNYTDILDYATEFICVETTHLTAYIKRVYQTCRTVLK
jgi:hypothetical protein